MKTVILTSGPRGAGKSTYVELVKKIQPEVMCMSRDELLIELFGKTSLCAYTGEHEYARLIFERRLKEVLKKDDDSKIIIDYWNGFSKTRQHLIEKFREYGADRVICWQFVISIDVCLNWFFKKSDSVGYSENGCRRDHKLYYNTAKHIDKDGFDAVYHIDPLQFSIPGFPLV